MAQSDPQLGTCQIDDQLAPPLRTDIQLSALQFAQKLVDRDYAGVYRSMSKAAKDNAAEDKAMAPVKALVDQISPLTDLKIEHVYRLATGGIGGQMDLTCDPKNGVAVYARSAAVEAYALLSAHSRDNDWAITLWLVQGDGGRQVQNFNINASKMAGKDPDALLALARSERKAGHLFSAELLYVGVRTLLQRGEIIHLKSSRDLDPELASFASSPELQTNLPAVWTENGHPYTVSSVIIFGDSDKLGLRFYLPDQDWKTNDDAEAKNKAFLDAFRVTHPECEAIFGVLQVKAIARDKKSTYVTEYEYGKGYTPSPQGH